MSLKTVKDKVERLIDKAKDERLWYLASADINLINQNSPFRTEWTQKTIPKINFSQKGSLASAFLGSQIEYIDYYINSSSCTVFSGTFSQCEKLKRINGIDTSNVTTALNMFAGCHSLESITEKLNLSTATNISKIFDECQALREVRFVNGTIKKTISIPSAVLSDESIQSIIDGLETVTTAQTLTLHADVKAKLTQTQLDTITGKNWNLA